MTNCIARKVMESLLPVNKTTQTPMWILHSKPDQLCRIDEWVYTIPIIYSHYVDSQSYIGINVRFNADYINATVSLHTKNTDDKHSAVKLEHKFNGRYNGLWHDNFKESLRILYRIGLNIVNRPTMDETIRIAMTTVNKYRPYATCGSSNGKFRWLDQCPHVRYKFTTEGKMSDAYLTALNHFNASKYVLKIKTTTGESVKSFSEKSEESLPAPKVESPNESETSSADVNSNSFHKKHGRKRSVKSFTPLPPMGEDEEIFPD